MKQNVLDLSPLEKCHIYITVAILKEVHLISYCISFFCTNCQIFDVIKDTLLSVFCKIANSMQTILCRGNKFDLERFAAGK